MFAMGPRLSLFCFLTSLTATTTIDVRKLSTAAFVGCNPAAVTPLATRCLKTSRTSPFQLYFSNELDEEQKTDELRRDTNGAEKGSVKLADDAVAVALKGVEMAQTGVEMAQAAVKKAQTELDKWNEIVRSNLSIPNLLSLYITERDKANERLKEANERLKEANDFKLSQDRQVFDLDVAALKAKEVKAKEWANNFVDTIMKEDVLEDNDGMKVMRNIPKLESRQVRDVVIRNNTHKFWQQCIDTVATKGHRVCAVGTPGIGKTTATPYLIRMLLKTGNTVVYLVRSPAKNKWYYEFTPTSDNIVDVAVYPERKFIDEIPSLDDNATYYIVDPGETKDNCVSDVNAKFILVASPDEQHWGESEFEKYRDGIVGIFLYFPLWKLEELLCANSILGLDLSEDMIRQRYRQFGGVPRYILQSKTHNFSATLNNQDRALSSVTADMAESMYFNKLDAVGSFGAVTKSAVMGFDSSEDDNFEFGVPVIISALVYEKVCNKYMTNLWNLIFSDGERGRTLFEVYTRLQMSPPSQSKDFLARSCVGLKDKLYKETGYWSLGGCTSIRVAVDIVDAAKKSARVLFHSTNKRNPLIDFIYQDEKGIFHAFQVTVGKNHKANITQIEMLENQIEDAENNLRLYYLVPSEIFANFVTDPVEPDVMCSIYHVLIPRPGEQQLTEAREKEDREDEERKRPGERTPRKVLESYIQSQLTQPNKTKFFARPCVGKGDKLYNKTMNVTLGGCNSTEVAQGIVDSAKKSRGVLLQAKTNELIDLMYQDNEGIFHVFKSMLGKQRKQNKVNLTEIKGLENQIDDAPNKLRLYFLVREEKFAEFVTTPVKPNVSCSVYHLRVPNPKGV